MAVRAPMPPKPATVAVLALPRVTGALRLQRQVPRYERAAPATLHFCFICGATLPPWRAGCFHHDTRQGRGLPPPIRLLPIPPPPARALTRPARGR